MTAPVKGATLIGNGPEALTRVSRVGQRSQARRGRRHLRQGRAVGPGGRGPAHHPHRRHDGRRHPGLTGAMRELPRRSSCSGRRARGATAADAFVVEDQSFSAQVRLGAGGHGQARPRAAPGAARLRGQVGRRRVHVRSLARVAGPAGGRGGVARAHHEPRRAGAACRTPRDLARAGPRSRPRRPARPRPHPRGEDRAGPPLRGGRARGSIPRITNSEGGDFCDRQRALRLRDQPRLRGRVRARRRSASSVSPGGRARTARCSATAGTTSPASARGSTRRRTIGRTAARRALRRLGARRVKTAEVPVIFDPRDGGEPAPPHRGRGVRAPRSTAGALPSWWTGWASASRRPSVTIVDDGTMPGAPRLAALRRRGAPDPAHRARGPGRARLLSPRHLQRPQARPAVHPPRRPRRQRRDVSTTNLYLAAGETGPGAT